MFNKPEENDLFFTASFIEYLSRKTMNTKKYIVKTITKEGLNKIYTLASVYHCDNMDAVCEEFINEYKIKNGNYDVTNTDEVPSRWDMGKVIARLAIYISNDKKDYLDNLYQVFTSDFMEEKLDKYENGIYSDNPANIKIYYLSSCK